MPKSITKTIRIRAVDLPYVERIMAERKLTWSGAMHYIIQKSVNTECKHHGDECKHQNGEQDNGNG